MQRIECVDERLAHFRVVTGPPTSDGRELIGHQLTLDTADLSVLFDVDISSGQVSRRRECG